MSASGNHWKKSSPIRPSTTRSPTCRTGRPSASASTTRYTTRPRGRSGSRRGAGDAGAGVGGDEFAVLLKKMEDEQVAGRVGERITRQLVAPFAIGGKEISIRASIGIAGLVSGQEAADDLIRNAD